MHLRLPSIRKSTAFLLIGWIALFILYILVKPDSATAKSLAPPAEAPVAVLYR